DPPGFRKFFVDDKKTGILINGSPDVFFIRKDGKLLIVDYKTSKLTDGQQKLMPQYEVQLNAYAFIARGISDKMVRRHPHVFGDKLVESQTEQNREWEVYKAAEREARAAIEGRPPSALDGVALALPALMRSDKLQRRAARVGFDWPDIAPVIDKVVEEIEEVRAELSDDGSADARIDEIGDLLFACVNLARHAGVDPEAALRRANQKFEHRFRGVETALAAENKSTGSASLDEMEGHWQQQKLKDKERKKK
ncbi:uncharacterized protein METZ01_LOCUS414977, partial [marine metagenome]